MPKLFFHKSDKIRDEIEFIHFISIGKDTINDIVLDSSNISQFHASIQENDGKYMLIDQSNSNIVTINGEIIYKYILSNEMDFKIDKFRFTFYQDTEEKPIENKVRLSKKKTLEYNLEKNYWKTTLTYVDEFSEDSSFEEDLKGRFSVILNLSNELVSELNYNNLIEKMLDISMKLLNADRGFIALKNLQGQLVYANIRGFDMENTRIRISETIVNKVIKEGNAVLTPNAIVDEQYKNSKSVLAYKLKSVICVPLCIRSEVIGLIYLDNSTKASNFTNSDLDFMLILARQMAIAIENARLHQELQKENELLTERLQTKDGIILKSEKMVDIYQKIKTIAKTNVPVLILGETGTGKELVAQSIHNLSGRKGKLISLNCSAIPETLVESELFGHDKGAFTHAIKDKPGKFEEANGGTIFLDEIGDMNLLTQPKLLRVLQENIVTRLGSTNPIKVDTRIVAATNKDLKTMMKEDKFRQDLYYRLADFDVVVPPLRERKEEIPLLANSFLVKFCEENNWTMPEITPDAMDTLMAYDWPGNINELRGALIKGAVSGDGFMITASDLPSDIRLATGVSSISRFASLEEMEKEHIHKALKLTNNNKSTAAELLEISRDTIYKKMEKYKIQTD